MNLSTEKANNALDKPLSMTSSKVGIPYLLENKIFLKDVFLN